MTMRIGLIALLSVVAAGLLSACSGTRPANLGMQDDGRLAPCPDKPNCVSSLAPADDQRHYIAPLNADDNAWLRLNLLLTQTPRMEIIQKEGNYLRAEATTRVMGFVDDLEFLYHPEQSTIHVRSASRLGHSDLGANRRRLESLRSDLRDTAL